MALAPLPHHISIGFKRARETGEVASCMIRTVRHRLDRPAGSQFCMGMALLTAVVAAALVIYSAAKILVLLR